MNLSFKNYPNLNDHLEYLGLYDDNPEFPQEGDLITLEQVYFLHNFVKEELTGYQSVQANEDDEIAELIMNDANKLLEHYASYSHKAI